MQDNIETIDTAAGLEKFEEFELGLEEVWERECSSDSDVDEVLLTNRSCHLTTVDSLIKFFTFVGLPVSIQSDQGSNFMSGLMQQVPHELGV